MNWESWLPPTCLQGSNNYSTELTSNHFGMYSNIVSIQPQKVLKFLIFVQLGQFSFTFCAITANSGHWVPNEGDLTIQTRIIWCSDATTLMNRCLWCNTNMAHSEQGPDLLLSSKVWVVIKDFFMVLSILIPAWIRSCLIRVKLLPNPLLQWEMLVWTRPSAHSGVFKEVKDIHRLLSFCWVY